MSEDDRILASSQDMVWEALESLQDGSLGASSVRRCLNRLTCRTSCMMTGLLGIWTLARPMNLDPVAEVGHHSLRLSLLGPIVEDNSRGKKRRAEVVSSLQSLSMQPSPSPAIHARSNQVFLSDEDLMKDFIPDDSEMSDFSFLDSKYDVHNVLPQYPFLHY